MYNIKLTNFCYGMWPSDMEAICKYTEKGQWGSAVLRHNNNNRCCLRFFYEIQIIMTEGTWK
jgi:hypothetical protein